MASPAHPPSSTTSVAPAFATLPAEIKRAIYGKCDPETLRSLSTVSREIHAATKPFLLDTVYVREDDLSVQDESGLIPNTSHPMLNNMRRSVRRVVLPDFKSDRLWYDDGTNDDAHETKLLVDDLSTSMGDWRSLQSDKLHEICFIPSTFFGANRDYSKWPQPNLSDVSSFIRAPKHLWIKRDTTKTWPSTFFLYEYSPDVVSDDGPKIVNLTMGYLPEDLEVTAERCTQRWANLSKSLVLKCIRDLNPSMSTNVKFIGPLYWNDKNEGQYLSETQVSSLLRGVEGSESGGRISFERWEDNPSTRSFLEDMMQFVSWPDPSPNGSTV